MPLYNTKPRAGGEDMRARAIMRREVYRHFSLPGRELLSMDFRKDLAKVNVSGARSAGAEDPITPPHLATEIASSLPRGAQLEIFDGCDPDKDYPRTRGTTSAASARSW